MLILPPRESCFFCWHPSYSFICSKFIKNIEMGSPCMDNLHASHDEMDFLALLESESLEDSSSSRQPLAEINDEQLVPVQESCPNNALVERGEVGENEASPSMNFSFPSLVGKVGSGRHGSPAEKNLLMYHMRHVKSLKKTSFSYGCGRTSARLYLVKIRAQADDTNQSNFHRTTGSDYP